MTALIRAHSFLLDGPGARLVILAIAAFATLVAWCAGYLVTLELSPFRMAVIVALLASLPVLMVHFELLPPLFLGFLWARVSDVAVATHGVPSIATPLAALLLGSSLLKKLMAGQPLGFRTFGDLALALPYTSVVALSTLWSAFPARSLTNVNILVKDLVIFWMLADSFRNPRTLLRAAEILVLSAALLSLPSLHQYFTSSFTLDYAGFARSEILNIVDDFDSYRLGGPLNSPNYFALVLLITVPVGLALLRTSLPALERVSIALLLLPIILTVLLTFSRGGSVLLALLVLLSLRRMRLQPAYLILALVAAGAILVFTPARVWDRLGTLAAPITSQAEARVVDESVELRIGAQRTAIEMFLSHPFLGVGAGNFPALYQDYSRWLGVRSQAAEYTPHNLYLEILAETGIVGLITFLITAFMPLVTLHRARAHLPLDTREGQDHMELSHGLELALVGWLIAGFFEQGAFPRYYWMLLALVIGAAHADCWPSADRAPVGHLAPVPATGTARA